jgi:hypothetical protein
VAANGQQHGADLAITRWVPKNEPKIEEPMAKKPQREPALRDAHLSSGIMNNFGDNVPNETVAFRAQDWRCDRKL